MYTNLPNLLSCIFPVLQHVAAKLCNFSNFGNFFPEISFFAPKLGYNSMTRITNTILSPSIPSPQYKKLS